MVIQSTKHMPPPELHILSSGCKPCSRRIRMRIRSDADRTDSRNAFGSVQMDVQRHVGSDLIWTRQWPHNNTTWWRPPLRSPLTPTTSLRCLRGPTHGSAEARHRRSSSRVCGPGISSWTPQREPRKHILQVRAGRADTPSWVATGGPALPLTRARAHHTGVLFARVV